MKTLLRLFKRLTNWINYPTSRERMWHMFYCGKVQGEKEALARLPITQVQPAVPKQIVIQPLHLPPGIWSKQYFEEHPEHRTPLPSSPLRTRKLVPPVEFVGDDFPDWLNSSVKHMTPAQLAITKVDTHRDLTEMIPKAPKDDTEGEPTEHMKAVQKLYYITRTGPLQKHVG